MVAVREALVASHAVLVGLLLVLVAQGLGASGVLVGLACGGLLYGAVARDRAACGIATLGPADVVTLARAVLACALAALVTDAALGAPASQAIVPLAVVALLLDAVDGRVARATETTSVFGARFDGETDAFLLLVLSAHVAGSYGGWVLAIGLARYAYAAAGRVWPWLRGPLPFRYWRKVVTAVQGIVLTLAAAGVLPAFLMSVALVAAIALLAESFGRDVLWSWLHRARVPAPSLP